jgi:beta-glucosidase
MKNKPIVKILTGFEPTRNTSNDGILWDILGQTEHYTRYKQDLALVKEAGINTIRVSVPWHRIESTRGTYDFSWMDSYMAEVRSLSIEPIMDPLHHTSWPVWLTGGMADPEFCSLYEKFFTAVVLRYDWVLRYTIINEPLGTASLCGKYGAWSPRYEDDRMFMLMIKNCATLIQRLSRWLRTLEKQHVFIDVCTNFVASDEVSTTSVERLNMERFQLLDLLLGKVHPDHPLFADHFIALGFPEDALQQFVTEPAFIDTLGLDYYEHSEFEFKCGTGSHPTYKRIGLCDTALQFSIRYRLPTMIAETNIRGLISDRISWFKYALSEYEKLAIALEKLGIPLEGFCWFPFIDSACWGENLCRIKNKVPDPVGIIFVDETWDRQKSEFFEIVKNVTSGTMTAADIVPYVFQEPLDHIMEGIVEIFCQNWKFKEVVQ